MARQMIWTIAIKKARAVTNIAGNVTPRWKIDRKASAQCVPLIVIEEEEICRWREVRQSTSDRTLSLSILV